MKSSAEERLKNKYKIIQETGCWKWIGFIDDKGYGRIRHNGKWTYVHRVTYELKYGYVPERGIDLDHLCRNRDCINPDHLEAVSHAENCRRGAVAGEYGKRNRKKTHCPKGHIYSGKNLYAHGGNRYCLQCRRDYMREYMRKYTKVKT